MADILVSVLPLNMAPTISWTCSEVKTVSVSVTVFVNVILSPSRAIDNPVPASRTTSSFTPALSDNLIFSSSLLSPSTHETEYDLPSDPAAPVAPVAPVDPESPLSHFGPFDVTTKLFATGEATDTVLVV